MNVLVSNLADAWRTKATEKATVYQWGNTAPALFKPAYLDSYSGVRQEFEVARDWFMFWSAQLDTQA